MELKLTHESICINEVVYDAVLEQPIELDYLLPDYCKSIFKILKCRIAPKITSQRIVGGKLMIDGVAYIKVLYVGEECYQIKSITQKQVFSKAVELKEPYDDGMITAYCKCDYANCRVINQHRLDIRGAISIKASISCHRKLEVVSKATGMGIQINNRKIVALGQRLSAAKEFSIKEELELSYGKPPITEILDQSAIAMLTDYKIIQNKIVMKGEISLHILYCSGEDGKPEIMEHTVPISQIVDLVGINEDYQCVFSFDVTGIDISLKTDGDGDCSCFDAEFMIRAIVEANKNDEAQMINDVYSTGYEVNTSISKVKIEQLLGTVNETCTCKASMSIPQNQISCVYDITSEFTNESAKYANGCIEIAGNLNTSMLALDCENMPIMLEKCTPCEIQINCNVCPCSEDVIFNPIISVSSLSYNLVSGDTIEIRAEVRVCGNLFECCYYNIVNQISIDEAAKKSCNDSAVICLYFAVSGECVWDIAKRFNTSVQAIMEENCLDSETLSNSSMLLIPIVG